MSWSPRKTVMGHSRCRLEREDSVSDLDVHTKHGFGVQGSGIPGLRGPWISRLATRREICLTSCRLIPFHSSFFPPTWTPACPARPPSQSLPLGAACGRRKSPRPPGQPSPTGASPAGMKQRTIKGKGNPKQGGKRICEGTRVRAMRQRRAHRCRSRAHRCQSRANRCRSRAHRCRSTGGREGEISNSPLSPAAGPGPS